MSPLAAAAGIATFLLTAMASLVDSALFINTGGPEQPCTTTITKLPSFETDCTFTSGTVITTESVDCGGCVCETEYLGHGIPCQTSTTVPGLTTTTTTVCSTSSDAPAVRRSPTPTSACTKTVVPSIGALSSATCTFYDSLVTATVSEDCGGYPGCVVATAGGHGPAVQCGTKVTSPVGTVTATTCTA